MARPNGCLGVYCVVGAILNSCHLGDFYEAGKRNNYLSEYFFEVEEI